MVIPSNILSQSLVTYLPITNYNLKNDWYCESGMSIEIVFSFFLQIKFLHFVEQMNERYG